MRMLSPSRPNGCSQQIDGSVQTRLAQGRRGKGTRGLHLGTDYSTWGWEDPIEKIGGCERVKGWRKPNDASPKKTYECEII